MAQPGGLLAQLSQATRSWHPDADEPWLDLLRPDVRRGDYIAQLTHMYGFEAALESACRYTPRLAQVLDVRHLTRAGLIAQDLLALRMTPSDLAAVPQCFSITPFQDVPEAFGWLYVVERSTQHYDTVRRHLQRVMPEVSSACAYLSIFERTPDHWQHFGHTLDLLATRPQVAAQIVEAATAGFAVLQSWFRKSAATLLSTG